MRFFAQRIDALDDDVVNGLKVTALDLFLHQAFRFGA